MRPRCSCCSQPPLHDPIHAPIWSQKQIWDQVNLSFLKLHWTTSTYKINSEPHSLSNWDLFKIGVIDQSLMNKEWIYSLHHVIHAFKEAACGFSLKESAPSGQKGNHKSAAMTSCSDLSVVRSEPCPGFRNRSELFKHHSQKLRDNWLSAEFYGNSKKFILILCYETGI